MYNMYVDIYIYIYIYMLDMLSVISLGGYPGARGSKDGRRRSGKHRRDLWPSILSTPGLR